MFHAQECGFDNLVSIFIKWIGGKPILECSKGLQYARAKVLPFLGYIILAQNVIIHIYRTIFALVLIREMDVVTDVECYIIIVNGIHNLVIKTVITVCALNMID